MSLVVGGLKRSSDDARKFATKVNGSDFVAMKRTGIEKNRGNQIVHIAANGVILEGALITPAEAQGVVLFAHGSGSSRHSPRNNFVAQVLQDAGVGTLLFDLLTRQEDAIYKARSGIAYLWNCLVPA